MHFFASKMRDPFLLFLVKKRLGVFARLMDERKSALEAQYDTAHGVHA